VSRGLGGNGLNGQFEECGLRLFGRWLAIRLIRRWIPGQPPRIEFQNAADKFPRIFARHFKSSVPKFDWNWFTDMLASRSPLIEAGFEFEQFAGNRGFHICLLRKSFVREVRIEKKETASHAG